MNRNVQQWKVTHIVYFSVFALFIILPNAYGQQSPFQKDVQKAVDKGVEYLKKIQRKDGSWRGKYWDTFKGIKAGPTALALLTLLECGEDPASPAVQRGLKFLQHQPFRRTYTVALSIMAVERIFVPDKEEKKEAAFVSGTSNTFEYEKRNLSSEAQKWMVKAVAWLLRSMWIGEGWQRGGWSYRGKAKDGSIKGYKTTAGGGGRGGIVLERRTKTGKNAGTRGGPGKRTDHSNTQYALLGLNAAARCGIYVHQKHWIQMAKRWIELQGMDAKSATLNINGKNMDPSKNQNRETTTDESAQIRRGYWEYKGEGWNKSRKIPMTPIGVASVQIIRHNLRQMEKDKVPDQLKKKLKEVLLNGMAWLAKEYDSYPMQGELDGETGWGDYYDLYSIERAMMLNQVRTIEGHNWYREGAQQLIEAQDKTGAWKGSGGIRDPKNRPDRDIPETCFALLFLKRGTIPAIPIETER